MFHYEAKYFCVVTNKPIITSNLFSLYPYLVNVAVIQINMHDQIEFH
jgi:hypothetical protein